MHPSYEIPPPIGYTPSQPGLPPPIGGVDACPLIEPPIGGEIGVTMIPSYPLTPAIGSYAGTHPMNLLTPSRGSTPSTIVAQTAIIPPVGGPSNHQGYLSTDY